MQAELLNPFLYHSLIDGGSAGEHTANVFQMFFRSAFTMENELVDYDRLRRSKPSFSGTRREAQAVGHLPPGQFTAARQVAVGPQCTVLMYNVKMPARFTL